MEKRVNKQIGRVNRVKGGHLRVTFNLVEDAGMSREIYLNLKKDEFGEILYGFINEVGEARKMTPDELARRDEYRAKAAEKTKGEVAEVKKSKKVIIADEEF